MTVHDRPPPDKSRRGSLVDQLVEQFTSAIDAGTLQAGARLPSVRELARERSVSLFTAAEALSRLTAEGLVEARAGSGYYVVARGSGSSTRKLAREPLTDSIYGLRTEHSRETGAAIVIDAGCGWLEPQWCDTASVDRALRSFARQSTAIPAGYGSALGLPGLRTQLCKQLFGRGIEAHEDQLLLTGSGATQALDLIVRTLLERGQSALVERPCYPGLLALLRLHGITPEFVTRTPSGPNVEELDAAASRSNASVLFTNSTLHNPTGSSTSVSVAHAILQVAARHGLTIVEDDLFWDLSPKPPATLASLDGLRSVVYVSGFSKSITPALRVGYMVGDRALVESIAATKITSTLGSSALAEGVVLEVLKSAEHRRHLPRLRQRLHDAHERVAASLKRAGFTLFCEPHAGLFLWAAAPADADERLARDAAARGILLAPAHLFGCEKGSGGGWFRFNVSYSDDPRLHAWLQSI